MEKKLNRAAKLMGITSICTLIVSIIVLLAMKRGIDPLPYLTIQICMITTFLGTITNFIVLKKKYNKHKK